MFISKPNKREPLNSITDSYNGLMDNFQKKKNMHDRNFKLKMSLNANSIRSQENDNYTNKEIKRENKYTSANENENLSVDKLIKQKNFNKKYSKIMSSVSPKHKEAIFPNKNINLWDLKLKKNSEIDKDQSLKRLENFKLNMIYSQNKNQNSGKNSLEAKTFKMSNSSDFFKSTINSDCRTFSSSRNSFNPNNNNNFNSNTFSGGFFNEKNASANTNANANFNANMSFNSFKSVSSSNIFNKKFSEIEINANCNSNFEVSPKSSNNNYNNNGKTKRVNFDDFNLIGENPFKINIYDNNNIAVNNTSKNYSKYGKMKDGYNLSPRNLCSTKTASLNYHSNKHVYKIDEIYEKSPSQRLRSQKDLFNIDYNNKGINLNSPIKTGNFKINKFGISNEFLNSRQHTMKRIDKLLKNFNEESLSTLKNSIANSPKNQKNSEATFLRRHNKQRLLNLLK